MSKEKSKVKNFGITVLVIVCLYIAYNYVAGNKNTVPAVYTKHSNNYNQINYVNGVSFDINTGLLDSVTSIQKFDQSDGTYLYNAWLLKQDNKDYMLFQSGVMYMLVSEDTHIFIDDKNPWTSIAKYPLDAIGEDWFHRDGKNNYKMSNKNGVKKYIFPVVSDVSINPEVFGKYTGKLSIIEKDGKQWAVFAGVYGTDWKSADEAFRDVVDQITGSFSYNSDTDPIGLSASSDGLSDEASTSAGINLQQKGESSAVATEGAVVPDTTTSGTALSNTFTNGEVPRNDLS